MSSFAARLLDNPSGNGLPRELRENITAHPSVQVSLGLLLNFDYRDSDEMHFIAIEDTMVKLDGDRIKVGDRASSLFKHSPQ